MRWASSILRGTGASGETGEVKRGGGFIVGYGGCHGCSEVTLQTVRLVRQNGWS